MSLIPLHGLPCEHHAPQPARGTNLGFLGLENAAEAQ